jgi:hypothetical protein
VNDDEQLERRSACNSEEQRVYDLTNQACRSGRMCGSNWYPAVSELRWNDQLADTARKHAQDSVTTTILAILAQMVAVPGPVLRMPAIIVAVPPKILL